MQRRDLTHKSLALAAWMGSASLWSTAYAQAPGWNKVLFDSKSLAEAVKNMGGSGSSASAEVQLTAPEIAPNSAEVAITLACTQPQASQLALVIDKNPNPVAAVFDISPGGDAVFTTKVKMGQSSLVHAIAKIGNKFVHATADVRITSSGCGGEAPAQARKEGGEPMRIRATAKNDKIDVRALMGHDMETGQRRGSDGKLVPAWHIQSVKAECKGQTVFSALWGPAISKNPFLQFAFKGAKAGDKLKMTWIDNRGDSRTDEALIT